ncbi:nuclear transport factor 2 family protein [Bacillus cereus group sp. BfR-BA-01425]|uniref:nuclear transport factor 2 family protein n=1 Tax=Bacillus cereus group sp. BfR-BA-01425 TaxID=2920342 RepID=UPI001F578F39|nr:nuclear transport factor 2 family protein [Bacillus cereus group sp. BfR-BA-01425]
MKNNQEIMKNEQAITEEIIQLEKLALDKWFKGDTSGYLELWSRKSFSYFDGAFEKRIDSHEEITEFVLNAVEGKLFADSYDFCYPRVQAVKDMAVLTYQLHADTSLIDMHYNCIEVFQKEEDGWHVIHSTWSFIRPMDMDFGSAKVIV